VSTGRVRVALVSALSPDVQDAVLTGHDRAELGALLFCPPGDARAESELKERIRERLEAYVATHPSSSECVRRVALVFEPASLDAGETTDKGYLNQRRVLERRADLVDALYAALPAGNVIFARETA
jgi:feruloyl-CoA synthase